MLKVYNTLTGKKEKFVPLDPKQIKMYICGLTVQNYSHIGHIRSAINYDVIRRYLEYKGYDVYCVQNFTDINEKIIKRAEEENLEPLELAQKYTEAYLEDIDRLNIKRADQFSTATENIDKMQEITKKLIEKGFAYENRGNVYFSVEKFKDYGKLSGRNLEEMEAGSRIEVNKEKKHPMDFALWKKVEDDVIKWDSPWSKGWPGWHIECSAMILRYLGEKIDIHGGGTDLIFPHHENEIAQSEAYTGEKPFVKYWLHNGTVNLKGEKMSKSLGNFYTTREILDKFKPEEIRYFLLTKHYHNPINFNFEEVEKSSNNLESIKNTGNRINSILKKTGEKPEKTDNFNGDNSQILNYQHYRELFEKAMDNDFNSAEAIGVLNNLIKDVNKLINDKNFKLNPVNEDILIHTRDLIDDILSVLGIDFSGEGKKEYNKKFEQLLDYILEIREKARKNKNYERADQIRDDLNKMGIEVKDAPHGVEWRLKED